MNKNKNATPLLIFVVVSIILLLFVPAPEGFEEQPDPIQGDDESEETVAVADPVEGTAVEGTPAAEPQLLPVVAATAPIISGPEPDRENIDMTPVSASPITTEPKSGKNVILMIPASVKNA